MKKAFTPTFLTSGTKDFQKLFNFKLSMGFIFLMLSVGGGAAFGQSGSVFRDFNANGTKDTNEPLVSGVLVKAYNSGGTLCASATSAGTTSPNYTLPTTCTGQVRVEFEIPASGSCNLDPNIDYSSFSGSTNGTSVQFVSNTGTANFAIADPSDFNSSSLINPKLFTSCYVSGNNLGTGNVGASDAFISINYNPTGNSAPAPAHYSNTAQIGATWGVAYSKQAKKNFTSAVLKRHSGFGPLGSGGIYMIDPSKQLPDLTGTTQFLDFDAIGIPTRGTGTYAGQSVTGPVVAFNGVIGTNAERGLGINLNTGERDAQALAQSGRVSFGDIDVSDDGRYLYVMNLFDKKLYEIDLTDPQNPVAPTSANKATKIKSWAIPNPCDAMKGTVRPWSIGFYRGKVYVGIVCDGNISQVKADLNFSIHELNTISGVFTSIFTNTLDFPRGLTNGFVGNGSSRKGWFGWTDDWNKLKQGETAITWPQPILSDIEFDSDGSLILGFIDRTGLQGGWNNKSPITDDNSLYLTIIGGDLLRAYKKPNCQWELESAGKEGPSSSKAATGGATNGEGPGGGEFYYEEFFATQHRETALGGLAISFGSGDVVSTIYDPFQYDSFGIGWFDNTTGKKDKGYEVFSTGNNGQTPTNGTFSKGLTLGDLEIEAELPPLEIGNRVWKDTDKDGIQDAGENGIQSVTIELYADFNNDGTPDGAALGTTQTSATGTWYFNDSNVADGDPATAGTQKGLAPNKNYLISVGSADWVGGNGVGELLNFNLTNKDRTSSGLADVSDNDAALSNNIPTIAYKTGDYGQNNHTLDMGFFTCVKPVISFVIKQATCTSGTKNNDGLLTITTTADKVGISYGGTSYSGPTYDYATTNFTLPLTNALTTPTTVWIRTFDGTNLSNCRKDTSFILNPTPCIIPNPCNATDGEIGGTVFRDFNNTGTLDSLEIGLAGIPIKVFDCDGKLLGTTTTDKFGNYSFAGMPSSKVRVEFGTLPPPFAPTKQGADNGTTTQFVTAPNCSVDLGVNDPTEYCQTNPYLTTVCYVVGNPLASGYPTNGGANDALVSTKYDLASVINHDVKYSDMGSTWGISYNKLTKKLFATAWVKRHTGLGLLGAGGIYVVDYSAGDPTTTPPTKSNFIDLASLGVNVGTIASNSARGLTAASNVVSMDSLGWYATGKVGLADIDISDDFNSLFTISLATKEVIKVNISTYNIAGIKPTTADVTKLPALPVTCVGGESRPFGLKYYRGKLYVGVVCDGSTSQTLTDVKAAVYAYDFTLASWSTAVAPFTLDYRRGAVHNSGCQFWIPWTDDPMKVVTTQGPAFNGRCFPQPLLSDIEFDVDGSMILGFADRGAHMMGSLQPIIDNSAILVNGVNGGDILRVYNNNGTYVLESEGTTLGGGGSGYNAQGPGGGEYYTDNFPGHQNVSLGGLALLAGTNEVVYTSIDPTRFESAGYRRVSNTTGQTTKALELYYTPDTGMGGTFNKGAGLGDAEILCDVQPIEIGNRLWIDKNADGVQDPCEEPIANTSVSLYDKNGVKIAQTTTDVNGNYYFNQTNTIDTVGVTKPNILGPQPSTDYFVVIGKEDGSFDKAKGTLGTTELSLTKPNSTTNNGNVQNDSDAKIGDATIPASIQGFPVIPLTTPLSGSNHTFDAGFVSYGSIGDYVWTDTNNDGQQGDPLVEKPIKDVKVYLYNAAGTIKLDSTFTDSNGKYLFDSLTTGAYKVKFVASLGTIAAKQNTGTSTQDVSDSDANKFGFSQIINIDTSKLPADTLRNNPQIDAGFVPVGSIGDYVFEDLDKSNTQTAGDMPLAGVKVYLLDATTGAKLDSTTTDANGLYLLDSLVAGNYKVQFIAPTGTLLVSKAIGGNPTKDSNADPITGITDTVNIDTTKPINDPARDNRDVDAGIRLIPSFGSIGDYVWSDTNNDGQQGDPAVETPIKDVRVYLYDATGTTKLDSTLTDGAGKYLFDSLLTGGYKVKFVAPTGSISSKQNTGGAIADVADSDANKLGFSQVINIDASKATTDTLRNNPQIDAGFVPFGSIGDYVFNDKDNSNTQTAGDMPIEGIKVYLLDGTTGAKLDSTFTNTQGLYKFDSLLAGNYKVQFVVPSGMTAVTKDSGDDTKDSDIDATGLTSTYTIDTTKPINDPARDITSADAGIKGNPQYGSIGDYVWFDVNNDGQQGDPAAEKPIKDVRVYLLNASGVKIDSTLTDASGKYLFDSLSTGAYKVQFVSPTGAFPAKQSTGSDLSDSDANKLGFSQIINIDVTKLVTDTLRNNPQIDAGFVPFGSIGDKVFEDKDNSNTQTAGDLPVSGVKVYLLDNITGAKLDSTITNGAGLYKFDSLVAGNYKVQFVAPDGSKLVTKATGGNPDLDSNPDPATGITDTVNVDTTKPLNDPLRDITTVDAGVKAAPAYGSIGDYVWSDLNNDGQQGNPTVEKPIKDVRVYLYDATGTTKLDSALTDINGKYVFDSLITGAYKVKFIAPTGSISSKQNTGGAIADMSDSDANKLGFSQIINIDITKADTDTLRNNPQIDAGFVPVGSIGDYVFNDKDNSNTQTAADAPIEGIKVYLLDGTTGAKLDSTFTNTQGLYKFDSLLAGNYKVQFVVPSGMTAVTKDSGDDTKDSDIDATGLTGSYTIDTTKPIGDPTRDITSADAGIKGLPQYGSVGDYVWFDVNNDGQQGDPAVEKPIEGVKVYLYDGSGTTILDSTTTNATGKYLFDSLFTGAYKVKFISPVGTFPAKQNTGGIIADVSDSDANKLGFSQIINIDVTKLATDTLRNNPQIDAGFVPFGSLGDYVFEDKDNSNTQTAGDKPIACIKVYLLDATTGVKLDSAMTDISGKYLFDSLVAGTYKVQFVKPVGGTLVTKTTGGNPTLDSNPDPTTGITDAITIDTTKPIGDPLRDNKDVDAGMKLVGPFGSLGDYVWSDVNNDGQQGDPLVEKPLEGIKVYLYDGTGTVLMDSTVTNSAGKYTFDSLMTAAYKVRFIAPVGSMPSKQNAGADLTDNDANKLGWSQIINIDATKLPSDTLRNNPNIDAGFVPIGSIGDYVFEDKDDSKTQTEGDLPIGSVKVYLLNATTGAKLDSTMTDGLGKYLFDSLIAGNYKVQFVKPAGTNLVTKTVGGNSTIDSNPDPATGITDAVNIDTTQPLGSAARDNRDVDAGIKPQLQYGSIGDYVWTDLNNDGQQGDPAVEKPIKDVRVYLYDASGTTKLDSTLTDATGKYTFDSLLTGSYKVYFKAPVGTIAAKQNLGADILDSDANKLGWSQVVNIDVTLAATDTLRNNPKIDAGFVPVGSIGDYVFNDKDNSNTQSGGDMPIEGIKVYLLDNITGAKLDSTFTNGAGLYKFDSLVAGNYKVQFVVPAGMLPVTKDSGSDLTDSDIDPTGNTGTVTVDTSKPMGDPARDITSVDAGLRGNPQYGSIGDYVWSDVNNDGQQGNPTVEKPIEGVKVYLYNAAGTVKLDSTTTNAAGKYTFDSLLTGSYKVKFVAPVGTFAAKQNTNGIGGDATDSDANKVGFSQIINIDVTKLVTDTLRNNPQIDAGFVPFGSIGDYVFNDKDDSKTQTTGDLQVGGVKVYLLNATTGARLDSTITNGDGKYLFDSLVAGDYKVQFIAPNGTDIVSKLIGGNTAKDSNPDPATGITDALTIDTTQPLESAARDNRDVDAGLKGQPQYGSIGDYVWLDVNNDGQQGDPVVEKPINGVEVRLYDATGTTLIETVFTNDNGKYLFDSLLTGDYKVYFKAPVSTIAAKQNLGADVSDSDANKLGWSQVVKIDVMKSETDTLRNNPKIDAGFVPVGSIGDYVFQDKDNSNNQTAGDSPVQGVKVYLLYAITGAKLDSTVTNINGLYKFDSLLAGNYKVQFLAPIGMILVTKDSGADDKDSDPNANTGITENIAVDTSKPAGDSARDVTSVDAGLKANKVDIRLTKIADGNCKRKVGDNVTFRIKVIREDLTDTAVNLVVKDSLSANFQFVSAVSSASGIYNNNTGLWTISNLAKGDSAFLTVTAKIKAGATGLVCNEAWVVSMDKDDFDSKAGNKIETEDDFARVCVSIPMQICTARGEKAELAAPTGYTSYQWFKNGQLVSGATNAVYLATTFGEYTVKVDSGSCPSNGCCPIYVEEFCDCPPTICVPFEIQKTKSKK